MRDRRLFALLETMDLLIVDCRAASTDLFLGYFVEINLREVLSSLNARLTLVTPVNHEADSVEQLRLLSARLNGDCDVVVKNQVHSEHFRIYEDSKTRARVVAELQGSEITMSRLRLARRGAEREQRHRERGADAGCSIFGEARATRRP